MAVHPGSRRRDEWLAPLLAELVSAEAVAELAQTAGDSYWEAAVQRGLIDDETLVARVAERLRIQRAPRLLVSSQARVCVPEDLARRYRVLPLSANAATLEIATADPYDLDCEQTLAFATRRTVRMLLASPLRIAERIEEVYRPENVVSRLLAGASERYQVGAVHDGDDEHAPVAGDAEQPIVRLVDHIVADGIAARASDIHLEPGARGTVVRYRVDGVLSEKMTIPRAVAAPLISRIKIMARLDIADRLRPQGGRARVEANGSEIDLRVSTLPVAHGEKVVIRILDQRETARTLDSLGFTGEAARRIRRLLEARDGLILVTGPTGSGKTTTLYAMLRQLQQRGVNIITVEDPVEYRIQGIVQVQVNDKAGLTFASALRTILRQDPDIVLIGEVRDRETAAIAIQAALTGHLVFATLHTIDAGTAVMRLLDLGVEREKVAAALRGVVAQRLLRRVCRGCGRRRASLSACAHCAGSGYSGRVAIAEVVLSSPGLERAISDAAAPDELIGVARRDGAVSLWEAGLLAIAARDTSEEELRRVVEPGRDGNEAEPRPRPYDSAVSSAPGLHSAHTPVVAGVVDVYVLRREGAEWRVLVLQRAADTRCAGAWETVHGRIEAREKPEEAALRELGEETGLVPERLYNATVQPFYLHAWGSVQLAVVFAAVVADETVTLGAEHQRHEWLTVREALDRYVWPRSRDALAAIASLLAAGDAGPVEDVLRVK